MQDERDRLVNEINSLMHEARILSTELSPVYQRDSEIRSSISDTHGGPGRYNREGASQRKPLFEALTQIAVQHGRKKQLVKDMKRRISAYSKEVIRLEKEAAKRTRRDMGSGTDG